MGPRSVGRKDLHDPNNPRQCDILQINWQEISGRGVFKKRPRKSGTTDIPVKHVLTKYGFIPEKGIELRKCTSGQQLSVVTSNIKVMD